MNIEDTRWFKAIEPTVAFGAVWWLSALVGVWPHGPQSVAAAVLMLFCLLGAERVLGTLLAIVAIAFSPRRHAVVVVQSRSSRS